MRFFPSLRAGLALGLLLAGSAVQAQSFSTYELDRYYRGGAYVPFDGMPHTQRYNYALHSGIFYPGYDQYNLKMNDYYDRVDRAYKFGYRMPHEPFVDPLPAPAPAVRVGLGWGFFRRR